MLGITDIAIKAPIDKVWETVSDLQRFIRLIPETKEFRYTSQQRRGVGTSWEDTAELVGGILRTEGSVTEWKEKENITATFSTLREGGNRPNKGSWTITLSPLPNGANLKYVLRLESNPGLLLWPLLPLMNLSLARVARRTLSKVKKAIDAEAKGSRP